MLVVLCPEKYAVVRLRLTGREFSQKIHAAARARTTADGRPHSVRPLRLPGSSRGWVSLSLLADTSLTLGVLLATESAAARARTWDNLGNNQVLYQLSYGGP